MSEVAEDDATLMKKISSGDRAAFASLYKRQQAKVRYYLIRKGVRADDILDELVQEVFLKIWNKASTFAPEMGSCQACIGAISQNTVHDYWRKMERTPTGKPVDEAMELEMVLQQDEHGDVLQKETWLMLDEALGKRNDEQRSLFSMVYIQGLTMKECSDDLGIPDGTLKWRMTQIKKILRSEILK